MLGERLLDDLLAELPIRLGLDALQILLFHHLALGAEVLFIHGQPRHPVRLRPEQPLEMIRRHDLVVNRHVVRGVGVVETAHVFGQPVNRLRLRALRPLEHDVLEKMREPAAPRGVVLRADVIPHIDRHRRRGVILRGIDFEAVGQRAMRELDRRDRHRLRRVQAECEQREKEQAAHRDFSSRAAARWRPPSPRFPRRARENPSAHSSSLSPRRGRQESSAPPRGSRASAQHAARSLAPRR